MAVSDVTVTVLDAIAFADRARIGWGKGGRLGAIVQVAMSPLRPFCATKRAFFVLFQNGTINY